MSGDQLMSWWRDKGVALINERAIDLVGECIGYVPIENLLTTEELSEVGRENLPDLIEAMRDDGMRIKELTYQDGSKELHFFIE